MGDDVAGSGAWELDVVAAGDAAVDETALLLVALLVFWRSTAMDGGTKGLPRL